jgi:ParB-like chromosome segregation protein Spo0J
MEPNETTLEHARPNRVLISVAIERLKPSPYQPRLGFDEKEFKRMMQEPFKMTAEEIAEMAGCDRSVVIRTLTHLSEPGPVQHLLSTRRISARHVRELRPLSNPERKVELAKQAAEQGWSVQELHKRVPEAGSALPAAISLPVKASPAPEMQSSVELSKPHPGWPWISIVVLAVGSAMTFTAGVLHWSTAQQLAPVLVVIGLYNLATYVHKNRDWLFAKVTKGSPLAGWGESIGKVFGIGRNKSAR